MMTFQSLGDLAQSLTLSKARQRAEQNITRYSQELTTGLTSVKRSRLRSDFSALSDWERTKSAATVREKTLSEAITRLQAKQQVLASISQDVLALSNDMILATTTGTEPDQYMVSDRAKSVLSEALARLNTRAVGHAVFAGEQTSQSAFSDGETVLASLKAAVSGAVTAEDVFLGVQAWIDDDVSGFGTVAYLGGDEPGPPIRLDSGRVTQDDIKGNDPALKAVIESLALAALSRDSDFALGSAASNKLLQAASNGLRKAQSQMTSLEARLGQLESEAYQAKVRASSEIATTQMLKADAFSVDQYVTATKLQNAELQLEKIYALTARSARMSLLEYMR